VPKARELGVASMMGFLLFTDGEDNLGALNLYSSQPGAFTERSEHVGWLLASHAAVALSSARNDAQLHDAIRRRQDIGEALGILRERHALTEDEAFARLIHASQNHNIKLRDIARTINTTGDIPPTPTSP
jgi:GAF domain-containing protein